MDNISLSGLSRTVLFREEQIELALDDYTWEELRLFKEVAGAELDAAFGTLFSARLFAVAVWLTKRRASPRLGWAEFSKGLNPYRDLAVVLPADEDAEDEPDEKPAKKRKGKGDDSPEA